MDYVCAVCGGDEFKAVGERVNAECSACGSRERTRFFWLYLKDRVLRPGMRVMHVAPERAISKRIKDIVGEDYEPYDFSPDLYKTDAVTVRFIDLTETERFPDDSYDLITHLHVLEHIPVSLERIFQETMRMLKPGGSFVFGLPISSGISMENLWPDATPAERKSAFGQHDHVRLVGRTDFPRFLKRVLENHSDQDDFIVDPARFIEPEQFTLQTAITHHRAMQWTGDSLFHVVKRA